MNKIGKLFPQTTAFFVCDLQTKFVNDIFKFNSIVQETKYMMKVCKELEVPIIATEQYPKVLGETVPLIKEDFGPSTKLFEKTLFSMYTPEVKKYLDENHKSVKSIMIAGIEAHVCIYQTTLDLLEQGYDVHIVEEAVSSVTSHDRKIALERLKQSGAFVINSESIIFQMAKDSKHKNFKTLIKIVKERRDNNANL
ncbi:hypothetical protein DICPUDRAFT_155040 [Dictyostelium purpureum]|uniref:Isochorismatase-like domain-containing protein n=1 Tax=Dictyostelium purpureum TaxID=5786 RepID=F0ZSX4_DICPU|nr:uncharacterized protein DICPUDRAFT_155040 [Dictyostelium purpureum]EGC32954.1 hypothetical protein DICPUDRAFT_155040 [Dictyostelium purpureum]|eukprot:XP_003290520.1 hypothetical protein DICPUDRAFT_155040 [Dictyostelium purpureum]